MRALNREDVARTVVAALVGSVVALLVSPFTQTLSFLLNEYLARPILAIEYVEVVPEEQRVAFAVKEVEAVVTSDGYRAGLMRGIGLEPGLMAFQGRKDGATASELQTLKASTQRLIEAFERRSSDLAGFRKGLASGATEPQIRELAAKYQGPMPVIVPVQDVKAMRATLSAAVEAEAASVEQTLNHARSLAKALSLASGDPGRRFKLKLSVLNRGGTDGLIRHVGELRAPANDLTLKLRRASPPTKPGGESILAMAVPVAVTNPPAETERVTSVGKVEKNSMSEFWMEVDEAATSKEALTKFAGLAAGGKLGEILVVLLDHENRRIERRVAAAWALISSTSQSR